MHNEWEEQAAISIIRGQFCDDESKRMRGSDRALRATISVIGGKWKAAIICALRVEGLRYGVLLRRIPRASRKVLTEQLRELQREKIVSRVATGKRFERVEYSLTQYGRTLIPVLDAMADWGGIHLKTYEIKHAPELECANRKTCRTRSTSTSTISTGNLLEETF